MLYMVTWIPSIYPSHVSIYIPAPWILWVMLHTDPEAQAAQAQKSINTREFCPTSNGKDLMFNYVAKVLTSTCCFMLLLHIVRSEHVASTYHMESTIQSLGFLIDFQEDIKSPGSMEQLSIHH